MKILLLSAYDAASHRRWHTGMVNQLPHHDWTVLTLPPRFFTWRIRGNSLSWAFGQREILSKPYDLLIATSMTDLAALRGFCPELAKLPTIVYFHENQFAYPLQYGHQRDLYHFRLHNFYTALCADQVLFNTEYNQQSFFAGLKKLLKKVPDAVPPGLSEMLQQRSQVLAVPLEDECFQEREERQPGPIRILWNHRWEFDKAPERFFQALSKLQQKEIKFDLYVAGQQFKKQPPIFNQVRDDFSDAIKTWGYVEKLSEYRRLLTHCDVIVSTALHDFQGLAVLEASASGCTPVVPNRLAYPCFFPPEFCYKSYPENEELESNRLCKVLKNHAFSIKVGRPLKNIDVSKLRWSQLKEDYEQIIQKTFSQRK